MQKHVNLVDFVKSFPTNIFLRNLASIQQRTSLIKFDQLAEKSEQGSISNLSTKVRQLPVPLVRRVAGVHPLRPDGAHGVPSDAEHRASEEANQQGVARSGQLRSKVPTTTTAKNAF